MWKPGESKPLPFAPRGSRQDSRGAPTVGARPVFAPVPQRRYVVQQRPVRPNQLSIQALIGGSSKVAGSVILESCSSHATVVDLAVDPMHRRQGVATQLVQAAVRSAHSQGLKEIRLEASPASSDISTPGVVSLYQRLGFRTFGFSPRGNPLMAHGSIVRQAAPAMPPVGVNRANVLAAGRTAVQAMLRRSGNTGYTPPPSPPPQRNRHTRSNSVDMTDAGHFDTPQYAMAAVPAAPFPFAVPHSVPKKDRCDGRQQPVPVDKHGNELFTGKRATAHWVTGFENAFSAANLKVCPRADGTCSPSFEIDHKTSFYQLLNSYAAKREVCDGTNHFLAYIYRFKGESISYPVQILTKNQNSVVRVYHWNDNLQWMCDKHNPSKSGKKDPDDLYGIEFLSPCPGATCRL